MSEKSSSPEFSAEEQGLITKLRERGLEDREVREQLFAWTEAQEAKANELNTSRANIEVNLKRAKFYHAAGLKAEAWENLESVRQQSVNEAEQDLYAEAMQLMDEIEASK